MADDLVTNLVDDCKPILASELPVLENPNTGDVIFAVGDKLHTTSLEGLLAQFNSGSLSVIYLTTPNVTDGRYQVIEAGTYTNVTPNITVTEEELRDNWVYISVVDGVATKQLISKPQGKQEIAKWANDVGLMYPEVRTHNEGIWRVIDGQTTINVDEPSSASSVWELIANISEAQDLGDLEDMIIDLQNNKQDILTQGLNITILNGVISAIDTTYQLATSNRDGLMSKEDKEFIDGIVSSSGVQFKGKFNNLSFITPITANNGDLAILEDDNHKALYQYNDGWIKLSHVQKRAFWIGGLFVKKHLGNTEDYLQEYDSAEGWVTTTMFVDGIYKGVDNPSQADLENKDNWSHKIIIE